MADAQASGAAGGAATGTTSTDPLAWISPAMKSELAALGEDVRRRAEAIYVRTVAEECKVRPQINMRKARKAAKARKKAIEKNTDKIADELMQASIAQAKKPPPRARPKAVVGGRRRRTRRSRGRRRRTRRRRNKRKSKSRRRNRRK